MSGGVAAPRPLDGASAGLSLMPRLDGITGLRWWAALAVFVFHFRHLVPLPAPVATVAQFGYLGVTFFFVLSGFVLTWSWRPTVDKRTFWWRRFARIWPLSVVTLFIALPVFYSFAPDPALPWVRPVDVGVLVLCLLLLQGWWRDPAILLAGNPAAWTLTVEVFFYATHPFVMAVLRRLTRVGALLAAAGVVVVAVATRVGVIADSGGVLAAMPPPLQHLNEFVLGMCVAWAFRRGWVPRIPLLVPVGLLTAWFATLTATKHSTTGRPVYDVLILFSEQVATVLCALLIVCVASLELRGRAKIMRARRLVALGEWSYAFYLVHATLIYAVINIFGRTEGVWAALGWGTVLLTVSIVVAWALHVGVERPVEKRMRAWQDHRRAARDAAAVPLRPSSEPEAPR